MAQANWTTLTGSLGAPSLQQGVTVGIAPPPGGGSAVYGVNSTTIVNGVLALAPNLVNFAPMAKGGSISGAIKRGIGGGATGFAPFFFIGLDDTAVSGSAYILGLSDAAPYHIVLRKGALSGGVPDGVVAPDSGNHILMRSTEAFSVDTWHHLRLDAIVQGTNDVIVQAYYSVLDDDHPVDDPTWVVIPGMEGPLEPTITGFVDDALGTNSGSAPHITGRAGFGVRVQDVARRAYFDHIEIRRQL
jgi:hypothetical protein